VRALEISDTDAIYKNHILGGIIMTVLNQKIDFAVVLTVNNANPNGDPLNGNRPRQNFDGKGEISDVALKRKIRNRLQDFGESIFVQSNDKTNDSFQSLRDRAEGNTELSKVIKDKKSSTDDFARVACEQWIDVRSFGQVFAFKGSGEKGVSVGVRGPVSLHAAISIDPVDVQSLQITKSVNSESGDKKGSDTMGMKHRINFGVYVFYGSINVQLAEKTGFTFGDANLLKEALRTLFQNDVSSARPEGSMEVNKLFWWTHENKLGQYSAAKVHRSVKIVSTVALPQSIDDYEITWDKLDGLDVEVLDGV